MFRIWSLVFAMILSASPAIGQGLSQDCPAIPLSQMSAADSTLVADVSRRIFSVVDAEAFRQKALSHVRTKTGRSFSDVEWPPLVSGSRCEDANAYATWGVRGDTLVPWVVVWAGELRKIAQGSSDVLAFTVGHELSHLLLLHGFERYLERGPNNADYRSTALNRQQEIAADSMGMVLALRSGYSRLGIAANLERMWQAYQSRSPDAPVRHLRSSHPVTPERLALLETDRSHYWRSYSVFADGVEFFKLRQWKPAQMAFRKVISEFEDIPEAWANLGFALLMEYADGLSSDDIQRFGIGHIVSAGFYRRARQLEPVVRGIDPDLWTEAVTALDSASVLAAQKGRELSGIPAYLGIAYLIRPYGVDANSALRHLNRVLAEPANNPGSYFWLGVANNAAVAWMAAGQPDSARAWLQQANSKAQVQSATEQIAAISYNLAKLSDLDEYPLQAGRHYSDFLANGSVASLWWPLAAQRYRELFGRDPALSTVAPLRTVVSLDIPRRNESGKATIALGDQVDELPDGLGPVLERTEIAGTNLRWLILPDHDVRLLVTSEVLQIVLAGPNAPAIDLKTRDIGGGRPIVVKPNMSRARFLLAVGPFSCTSRSRDVGYFYGGDHVTRETQYCGKLGLGIQFAHNKVAEIAILPGDR